jgi:hypothetical protein
MSGEHAFYTALAIVVWASWLIQTGLMLAGAFVVARFCLRRLGISIRFREKPQ